MLNSFSHITVLSFNLLRKYSSATKHIDVVVSSLRIDRVLATGLGIGRRKTEYSLLSGFVKLNGKTVTKKSTELKQGDILDRISLNNSNEQLFLIGRVKLIEIGETTKKGNSKVTLERTKHLQVSKAEYNKQWDKAV